eukprot:m.25756 g.25756  ORF g.25756 m.25756 type:complete len:784 (-) comp9916_c0_seq3:47-2398(-)
MGKKGKENEEPQFKPVSLAIEDVGTLILALKSKEVTVAGKACDAIDDYADSSDKNREHVASLGALPILSELVIHEDESIRHRATMCLSTLTKSYAVRVQCKNEINADLLPRLLPMLSPPTAPVGQENAAAIVANLCSEFSVRRFILSQGVIPALVALLTASQDITRHALRALLALCEDYDGRSEVMSAQPNEALLQLLDSEYREIQELALQVVAKAARNQLCRQALYEVGVLERIIAFVANPEYSKSHVIGLDALSTMLYEPPALERVSAVPDGGQQSDAPLVKVLEFLKNEDPHVKVKALNCLQAAAHDNDNRRILRDFKTEAAIVAQLVPDDPKQPINMAISSAACNALTALAVSKSSALAVLSANSLPKLNRLLSCEHDACILAASKTIAVLVAKSSAARVQVFESGVYTRLMDILSSTAKQKIPTQTYAAACIAAFGKEQNLRNTMAASSPMAALVALLSKGPYTTDLQEQCLEALVALATNSSCRQQLGDTQPYGRLVELVRSPDEHVGLAAARIVHQLSEDSGSAAALLHAGALEALRDVTASRSHSSETMRGAMQALLNQHLSAKFSLNNELDVTDKLTSLFFDCGKVQNGRPVPLLSDLLKAPLDGRRPTYLINPRAQTSDEKSGLTSIPKDNAFTQLMQQAQNAIQGLSLEAQYQTIAQLVSEHMGGAIPESQMKQFSSKLHLAQLQSDLGSNVIPIGMVRKGGYLERALLFKALADNAAVPCHLIRGEYGRAYNAVHLPLQGLCVVDVTHNPGSFHAVPSCRHLQTQHPFLIL